MENQEFFEFRYVKDNHDIDINTLVNTQKEFNTIINEIKDKYYPDLKIRIKVQPFKGGSFEIPTIIETVTTAGVTIYDNKVAIGTIIGIFKGLLDIRKHLKGAKATETVEQKVVGQPATVVNITINNSTINVTSQAWKEFQTNPKINKSIDRTIEAMDVDKEIEGFQIIDKSTPAPVPIVDVPRTDFEDLKSPNAYLHKPEEKIEEIKRAILYVKTIDYIPDKKSKYAFIYKDKVLKFKITAPLFLEALEKGERFGKGDMLIVNLKIYKKLDYTKDVYINDKYEISEVLEIKRDATNGKLPSLF